MKSAENFDMNSFEALFRHATIGIIVTDKQGDIVIVNRQAEVQFGYAEAEIKGLKIDLLVPRRVQGKHHSHREGFYQHPSPRRMGEGRDLFAQHKNGTEFPVEVSLSNYILEGEMYVIAFVIDITVRKSQEAIVLRQKAELENVTENVKRLNTELEEKVQARTIMLQETLGELEKSKEELSGALANEREVGELKSRFVTMASHEFRTPLSTILSSVYLLEKYGEADNTGKIVRHAGKIKSAVLDMKNILEDFLSLGKMDEGLVKPSFKELAAQDCFAEIQKTVTEMEAVTKPGQRLQVTCGGTGTIKLDFHILKNILANLLSNAIKFSPDNSVVCIDCVLRENDFMLCVKDQGIGISQEDKERLFSRFFRGKNAANIQGTGLGLHIITKYLELLNGSITVDSVLDEGTTFNIFLPLTNA